MVQAAFERGLWVEILCAPWKCFIRLTPTTNLHIFEVVPERARKVEHDMFDPGSINHFALEAHDLNDAGRCLGGDSVCGDDHV